MNGTEFPEEIKEKVNFSKYSGSCTIKDPMLASFLADNHEILDRFEKIHRNNCRSILVKYKNKGNSTSKTSLSQLYDIIRSYVDLDETNIELEKEGLLEEGEFEKKFSEFERNRIKLFLEESDKIINYCKLLSEQHKENVMKGNVSIVEKL